MLWAMTNWKLIAIGILSAALALTFKLWRGEVHDFAHFRAQVEVLGQAAEREKKRIETEHNQITKEMSDAWAQNLNAYRADAYRIYTQRLRDNAGRGFMPGITLRPQAPDGTGKERLAACAPDEAFIQDAAEDAARIGEWQSWARRIGFPVK